MLRKISDSYKRWRHTRGYGVHSPFAYKIVKEVLRQKNGYSYYAYNRISHSRKDSDTSEHFRMAKTLLRLASTLNVKNVFLPSGTSPLYHTALKGANSKMLISSATANLKNCMLICSSGDYLHLDVLREHLKSQNHIIALKDAPAGWRNELFDSLNEGVMFYGKKNILIICHSGMQKVKYSIQI